MTLVTCALSFLFVTYDTSVWKMERNACFYFSKETLGAELCSPQILVFPHFRLMIQRQVMELKLSW